MLMCDYCYFEWFVVFCCMVNVLFVLLSVKFFMLKCLRLSDLL